AGRRGAANGNRTIFALVGLGRRASAGDAFTGSSLRASGGPGRTATRRSLWMGGGKPPARRDMVRDGPCGPISATFRVEFAFGADYVSASIYSGQGFHETAYRRPGLRLLGLQSYPHVEIARGAARRFRCQCRA